VTDRRSPTELEALALAKLGAVLGAERAERLLWRTLESAEFRVRDPEDLARLGALIGKRGGIEGVLGSMLGVQAAMRGAKPPSEPP